MCGPVGALQRPAARLGTEKACDEVVVSVDVSEPVRSSSRGREAQLQVNSSRQTASHG